MKKYSFLFILTALFTLHTTPSMACKCKELPKLENLSQLSQYSFIATVVILDADNKTGKLKFRITELYRGKAITEVFESARNTSCDMGIANGQEWLLFAVKVNGKLTVRPCDRNIVYKISKDEKAWYSKEVIDDLNRLRVLFKKPPVVHQEIIKLPSNP